MMNKEEPALLSSELMLMSNVSTEVLWVVRHQQKDTASFFDPKVKIFLGKSKGRNSTCRYTLEEYASYDIAQNMIIENFLKGPIEQLKKLLSKTQGRSECLLRIGSHHYSLFMTADIITVNLVQQVTSSVSEVHDSYFEFHLEILISKSFEREHKAMEKKVEQNLQRYKMTNPEIVISFQSTLSSCERLITFPFNALDHTIKIGGLVISVEPSIYVSEAHVQSSRVTHVHIGQPIKLPTTNCDPTLFPVSYCQIGCVTIGCGLPGGRAGREQVDKNSKMYIKIFIHGPDGMPLFENREMSFTGDFKKMLEMESSFDMKIEDVPIEADNAEGSVRPDLMFKVTRYQMQPPTRCQKQERPPTFNLILHLVLSLEDQELLSTHSVVDCLEGLRQKFSQCFQGNECCLKNDIKQTFLELFEKRSEKGSRQRQKEEALERAVPTVVEAITTILSHSTNEKFRKNCLAYAGATDTMELASFLTDNLTSITNRSLYPKDVEQLDCAGPSELVATMTDKGSFSLLSDHQLDGSNTEELEELNDLDLLQAFSQGTDHESCSGEFNQYTVNGSLQGAESDHWTDLSQTTDEIVKSLLEEDSLDEDLLSADWLITEE